MSFNTTNTPTFVAAEDIGINIRVKLNGVAGQVAIAGAGEDYVGVTQYPAVSGKPVPVLLKNATGTCYFIAATSFAYGAQVYGVAAGKVDDVASTNVLVGTALEAATAGQRVEVLNAIHAPLASANQAVATDAASAVVLANALRSALIAKGLITGAA